MASLGSTTPTFNGSSTFASQLQTVITNAVSRASEPVTQLQSQQTSLTGQQTELQTLNTDFASLQSAITSLSTATGLGSYAANVSDPSVLSASVGTGVMPGTYTIDVTALGSQTSTLSQAGSTAVSDPSSQNISSSTEFTLTLDGQTYQISDSAGTLDGLAQAITNSSANVQATVVNVGSSTSPDYRLSVQSLSYAPDTIQLNDGTSDLLSTLSPGSYASYQVNGQPFSPIESSSRSITVSPGLSVQLTGTGNTSVTVSQSTTGISSALSSFATAYNAVSQELTKNRGQNGGALAGQSIVFDLQSELRNLATYSGGSGSVNSLTELGLTFGQSGNLQFDPSALSSISNGGTDLLNFLGSTDSGGFLQAAGNILTSISDPISGSLTQASSSITSQLASIQTKITDTQSQVSALQASLTTQMAQADATISSLQNQVSEITNLFSDMQTNSRAYSG